MQPKENTSNEILRDFTWKLFRMHYKNNYGHHFINDADSVKNVSALFNYFMQSEEFFNNPRLIKSMNEPSFEKGLLLIGGYGNGKTSMMQSFSSLFRSRNYESKFKMVNAQDMVMEWETVKDQTAKADFYHKYSCKILCIDDVKKERKASNYGISEVVGDVLLMRYNRRLKTHITCNYVEGDETQDLKKGLMEFSRYGEHFYDRIFEMFNIVEFKGKSLR